MKTETISMNVYEVGDVLELNRDMIRLESKRRCVGNSKRAIVVGASRKMDNNYSYKLVCDNGNTISMRGIELGGEKYVGHIDMGAFFGEAVV